MTGILRSELMFVFHYTAICMLLFPVRDLARAGTDAQQTGRVVTEASVNVQLGKAGSLPCSFEITPIDVSWNKDSPAPENLLVYVDNYYNLGQKDGPGYHGGGYDISANFSLILKETKVDDVGRYFCVGTVFESSTPLSNHTDLAVFVPPVKPFPTIEECYNSTTGRHTQQNCIIDTRDESMNVTCIVNGYYPSFHLFFHHEHLPVNVLEKRQWNNSDGTFGKTVTISIVPNPFPYICTASGILRSGGSGERSAGIILKSEIEELSALEHHRPRDIAIIFSLLILSCGTPLGFFFLAVRLSHRRSLSKEEENKCKRDLCYHYKQCLTGITTSSLETESLTSFRKRCTERFFVTKFLHSLLMFRLHRRFPESSPTTNKRFCVLLVGEGGAGKTTFMAKLVSDWIDGNQLKHINLLFYVPLSKAVRSRSFGEVIRTYLSHGSYCAPIIDQHIEMNQHSVMFLFDGLDELDGDVTASDPENVIVQIIRGEKYRNSLVVSTARPCKAKQILSNQELKNAFTCINMEGFRLDDAEEYVKRFIKDDTDLASCLIQFLRHDKKEKGVYSNEMASCSIYLTMLCHIWQDEPRQRTINNLRTISESMKEIVTTLRKQYSSTMEKKMFKCLQRVESSFEDVVILCDMGETDSKQMNMRTFLTISHFIDNMVNTLKEKYVSKEQHREPEEDDSQCMQRVERCFDEIGRIACQGCLSNQMIIDEQLRVYYKKSIDTAYSVGVLTREKSIAPIELRQRGNKKYIEEFRFPHKLLHKYFAAVHLATLYQTDIAGFMSVLQELIDQSESSPDRYQYLWYFLATRNNDIARTILEFLGQCTNVEDLVIRVAFECQDKALVAPFTRDILNRRLLRLHNKKSFAAHIYVLDTASNLNFLILNIVPESKALARNAAETIFSLKNLRTLVLREIPTVSEIKKMQNMLRDAADSISPETVKLRIQIHEEYKKYREADEFYIQMETFSSSSKIENLILTDSHLSPVSCHHFARSIFSMPHLRTLYIEGACLDSTFYETLGDLEILPDQTQIETIIFAGQQLSSSQSPHLVKVLKAMPKLRTLSLRFSRIDDTFYQALQDEPCCSKVERLCFLIQDALTLEASDILLAWIFRRMALKTLIFQVDVIHAKCFSKFHEMCSDAKIEKLSILYWKEGQRDTSCHIATGLCSLPHLSSLYLSLRHKSVLDELCINMKTSPASCKISTLILNTAVLTRWNVEILLSIDSLRSIRFMEVKSKKEDNASASRDNWSHSEGKVTELTTDDISLPHLLKLDVHKQCPQVKNILLDFRSDVTNDAIVKLNEFSLASHLFLSGYENHPKMHGSRKVNMNDSSHLCNSLMRSWPRLVSLVIVDIMIGDVEARNILQMAEKHRGLKNVTIARCGTTDACYSKKEQSEDDISVTLKHGKPDVAGDRNEESYTENLQNIDQILFDNVFKVITVDHEL